MITASNYKDISHAVIYIIEQKDLESGILHEKSIINVENILKIKKMLIIKRIGKIKSEKFKETLQKIKNIFE